MSIIIALYFSFKTGAAFTMNNKQVRGTLSFSGKKAELTVKTPWRDMTAEYTINGDLESFNANSLVRWAADKEISGEMTFDMNRKRMTFSLASPFYSKYFIVAMVTYIGCMHNIVLMTPVIL